MYANFGRVNTTEMETNHNDPLLCNTESGICEIPNLGKPESVQQPFLEEKQVKIVYFTDPICSSCWGIEPQLRKLKLEYGQQITIDYRMGGLLPDWSYNSGGISKPSDVARHWDEVSHHYDMPIDGDVWMADPLSTSYPPSIAFKAAQLQDPEKAVYFLREIREMVFLKKKNIAKWENLAVAAKKVGLDIAKLEIDFHGDARELFNQDLELGSQLGVRGFPTMFFANEEGGLEKVYGTKPYATYEAALRKQFPSAVKSEIDTDWKKLFAKFNTLTAREFSELTDTPRQEAETRLQNLTAAGELMEFKTKNGSIWLRD
jgi:putative protein-disulfide isomerase